MKKLIMTIAIVLGMTMGAFAQETAIGERGLFGKGFEIFGDREGEEPLTPGIPGFGEDDDQNAPLGSGIAVLMGLGAAYMVAKKRREE